MAITPKEKELAAGGISVTTGCNSCPDYHSKAVRKTRESDKANKQAVADASEVRRRAMEIIAVYAQAHLGEKAAVNIGGRADEITRVTELVSMRGGVWRELCRDS